MKFFGPHRPERVLLRRNTLYLRLVTGIIFGQMVVFSRRRGLRVGFDPADGPFRSGSSVTGRPFYVRDEVAGDEFLLVERGRPSRGLGWNIS